MVMSHLIIMDFDTFSIFNASYLLTFFNSGTRDFKVKASADFERLALTYTRKIKKNRSLDVIKILKSWRYV